MHIKMYWGPFCNDRVTCPQASDRCSSLQPGSLWFVRQFVDHVNRIRARLIGRKRPIFKPFPVRRGLRTERYDQQCHNQPQHIQRLPDNSTLATTSSSQFPASGSSFDIENFPVQSGLMLIEVKTTFLSLFSEPIAQEGALRFTGLNSGNSTRFHHLTQIAIHQQADNQRSISLPDRKPGSVRSTAS